MPIWYMEEEYGTLGLTSDRPFNEGKTVQVVGGQATGHIKEVSNDDIVHPEENLSGWLIMATLSNE